MHPEKTPSNTHLINAINEKIKNSEIPDPRKPISLSTSTTIKNSKILSTPTPLAVMSPANKILFELKNASASGCSIQASLTKFSGLNTSRTVNTSKIAPTTFKSLKTALSVEHALIALEQSVDVLVAKAEEMFYNCEYKRCLKIIERFFISLIFFLMNN
jgi:anaphase-promoting complex subunit 6